VGRKRAVPVVQWAFLSVLPFALFLAFGGATVKVLDPAPGNVLPGILGSAGLALGATASVLLGLRWFGSDHRASRSRTGRP
jgi:hypothetical protein